jgi:pilus assembly protein CpaB
VDSKKILILAIFIGLLGVLAAYYYLQQKEAALLQGMQMQSVLVASRDIPLKTKLTKNLFKVEKFPERYISPKAIIVNTEQDVERVVDKINVVPISAGQQIVTSEIVPPSEEIGLSVNVPPNMRAIVVQINNIDVIDLLKPNDRVDVVTIFQAQHVTKGKVKVVSTILQDVLVLGVSKDLGEIEEDPDSFKKRKKEKKDTSKTMAIMTVSLALTPEQVQILSLAQSQGDIILSIRGVGDQEQKQGLRPMDSSIFLS